MAGVNKVIIVGRLGTDPNMRQTQSGENVASFSLATSESWTDKRTGEKVENTEWHNVVFFGKIADVCQKWLYKGMQVYVEGKLKTEKYQGKDGSDRYTTKIIGLSLQMLGSKDDEHGDENHSKSNGADAQGYKNAKEGGSGGSEPDFDDDVPF